MKHLRSFSVDVYEVGDRYLAEIGTGGRPRETVMSPVIGETLATSEQVARHFALKTFCAEIGDALRTLLQ